MRKRSLLSNNIIGKPIENANYADICFYDKENDNKIIVDAESFDASSFPLSRFTPIGIVAVPSSHTDEGRPRIVSLAVMDTSTPDSGTVNYNDYIDWGGYRYIVTDLPTKGQYPHLSNLSEDGIVNYSTGGCYLPADAWSGYTNNPLNSLEGFYENSDYSIRMCSPYKEDGSKEERYFDTSITGNVLADFNGKANTEKILAEDNSYSTDWQTATTIAGKFEDNYKYVHPAAQCCWRFHTDGTQQGDWYLPSCGELGYAYARRNLIDLSISYLNNIYNTIIGITFEDIRGALASSNQQSSSTFINISIYSSVWHIGVNGSSYCRAFLKL